jgi:outer membrane protein
MKKLFVHLLLGLAFLSSVAQAQTTPPAPVVNTVCFVNAQKILAAHPQGAKVLEAQQKAQAELKELSDKVQALQNKIANNTATPTERQQYETLVKTGQARQAALKIQIDKLLEPITQAVDVAITKVAVIRGCSLVLDRAIAAQSGLVVYVNPNTAMDITDDVILEIKKPA